METIEKMEMSENQKNILKIILPLVMILSDEPYEVHHPRYILEKIERAFSEGNRAFSMLHALRKTRLLNYFPRWRLELEDFYTADEIKELKGIFE